MRAVLAVAVDEGLIPINVAAGIKPRKAVGGKLVDEDKKWKPFTAEEMRTILEKAKEVRWGRHRGATRISTRTSCGSSAC